MKKKTPSNFYPDLDVFKETLGREARETIAAMDAAGDDIASQLSEIDLKIDRVGCTHLKTYFTLKDPLNNTNSINLYAKVQISIEVPETMRGIHVSRLSDSVARLAPLRTYESICDFARTLALDIKATQRSLSVNVKIEADYITPADVESLKGAPYKKTQDHFLLLGEVTVGEEWESKALGLEFKHITSCPCVQRIIHHARGKKAEFPHLTHSQRVITRVILSPVESELLLPDLLKSIDSVLFLTRDTLPRPGEAALVFRSHEKPQFIEDVIRQVALQTYKEFHKTHPHSNIIIKSRSLESIHSFDIEAELKTSMESLGLVSQKTKMNHRVVKSRWNAT
jgi:GTP cyclohydrolase FolE2